MVPADAADHGGHGRLHRPIVAVAAALRVGWPSRRANEEAVGTGWHEPYGQGWLQVGEVALAFVLASLIGLERELRQKNAGLRTHALVGTASALLVLVSKYGFADVLGEHVSLDPSRIAAQVVSGIGFIGGGVIFVRRDVVSGLTTAAAVWTTSAVGMAAGAGLPLLAALVTALHFVAVLAFPPLVGRIGSSRFAPTRITLTYEDGRGVLRTCLAECTARGFVVRHLDSGPRDEDGAGLVSVVLDLTGRSSISDLAAALSEVDGVRTVSTGAMAE